MSTFALLTILFLMMMALFLFGLCLAAKGEPKEPNPFCGGIAGYGVGNPPAGGTAQPHSESCGESTNPPAVTIGVQTLEPPLLRAVIEGTEEPERLPGSSRSSDGVSDLSRPTISPAQYREARKACFESINERMKLNANS